MGHAGLGRADGCNHVAHRREEGADRPEVERCHLPSARADRSKRSADCSPSEPDSGVAARAANRHHTAEQILWLTPVRATARRFRPGHWRGSTAATARSSSGGKEEASLRVTVLLKRRPELPEGARTVAAIFTDRSGSERNNGTAQSPGATTRHKSTRSDLRPDTASATAGRSLDSRPPAAQSTAGDYNGREGRKARTGNLFHFKPARRCKWQDLCSLRGNDPRNGSPQSSRRRLCRSHRMPRYQRHLFA